MRPAQRQAAATASPAIVKEMSISASEFRATLARLGPVAATLADTGTIRFAVAGGHVAIDFAVLPPVTLGKLLELPRAEVTLTFQDVAEDDRTAFLRRFDIAFQRGGG